MVYNKWYTHIGLSLILLFLVCSCDITQYKRIGITGYYLMESIGNEPYADMRYYKDGLFSESVKYKGFAKDLYWNDKYIIVKCTNKNSQDIINYCIIEQYGGDNEYVPWVVHQYATEKEFEEAKATFGLEEEKMGYTDSKIPLTLF